MDPRTYLTRLFVPVPFAFLVNASEDDCAPVFDRALADFKAGHCPIVVRRASLGKFSPVESHVL